VLQKSDGCPIINWSADIHCTHTTVLTKSTKFYEIKFSSLVESFSGTRECEYYWTDYPVFWTALLNPWNRNIFYLSVQIATFQYSAKSTQILNDCFSIQYKVTCYWNKGSKWTCDSNEKISDVFLIWGSHRDCYEEFSLLGYNAV
jgi:hypothetical protein